MKRFHIFLGVILFLVVLAFFWFIIKKNDQEISQNQVPLEKTSPKKSAEFMAGETTIRLEVAETDRDREQGLSGRANLGADTGMIFVFDEPDQYGFWMKDMKFPIDILWLDRDKKIVTILESVSPNSYPKVFQPTEEAMYVIELEASKSRALGLTEGVTLMLKGI